MKKLLLMFTALAACTLSYAQRPTHLIVDYDPATSSDCIASVGGNGGTAFTGGNADPVGYADQGSPDAIYFIGASGTLDPAVTPYYMYIMQVNDITANCEPMAYTDSVVDINASGVVKVTAKAGVDGVKIVFFIGFAHGTNFPTSGTYYYGDLNDTLTLTTSYQTYTVDWSAKPSWNTPAVNGDSINVWGVRMIASDDEVWVQKLEFGTAPVTGIKTPALAKGISVFPNPSAGNVKINTYNRDGKVLVTNPFGAVVETIQTSKDQESYELSLNDKGMYFLNFITSEGSATEKLVIE
jgi:hypothetical protein